MKKRTMIFFWAVLLCTAFSQAEESQNRGKVLNTTQTSCSGKSVFLNQRMRQLKGCRPMQWHPSTQNNVRLVKENGFLDRYRGARDIFSNHETVPVFSPAPMTAPSDQVTETWVKNYASDKIPSYDVVTDMVIDHSGNVYVTGYSTVPFGTDYLTVKYNPSGEERWSASYDGDGYDVPTDIVIDGQGYIYVTGTGSDDFTTIKYDTAGVEQWIARYDGPGKGPDRANALAVDGEGNVVVTGASVSSSTDWENTWDYATVKYNAAGVEQWVTRYDGPLGGPDFADMLVIDGQGNVYVTGDSYYLSWERCDYATVMYDADGAEQWSARYNGPGNLDDNVAALALDSRDNVIVTGGSQDSQGFIDYATIMYDAGGAELWTARYNGPMDLDDRATAIVVDGQDNIVVTGSSFGDYATVKYNAAGIEQWAALYPGNSGSWAETTAITVDEQNNIYVTGNCDNDYATVKYNASGVEQWVSHYNGAGNDFDWASAIAVDEQGNVFISGYSTGSVTFYDYVTVKYNSKGVEKWSARTDGLGKTYDLANATAMTIDDMGNVYVTGSSVGSWTSWSNVKKDYLTVKYDAGGVEQWTAWYHGSVNHDSQADAIAVDRDGNVYVTGTSAGDYVTVKYNSSGVEQWSARYDGPEQGDDKAVAVALDGQGNVYVTGVSYALYGKCDYATVKYNGSGAEQWTARYSGSEIDINEATALAVDDEGNVYATGTTFVPSSSAYWPYEVVEYATVKYNSSGVEQWTARHHEPENEGGASALAVDEEGNVYVTGTTTFFMDSASTFWPVVIGAYTTVKYNSSGLEQWAVRYNGLPNGVVEAVALALDGQGNVYVTGESDNAWGNSDYVTVKYDNSGVEQWTTSYNGPENRNDKVLDIAVDGQGNVYVTGESDDPWGNSDYATVKYNSSGVEQWTARYNGPGNSDDRVAGLALDGQDNVYIAGTSSGSFESEYIFPERRWAIYSTVKYSQTVTGIEEKVLNLPITCKLEQNHPNPFNPATSIEYDLPKPVQVRIVIYDILGRQVKMLENGRRSAGHYRITWDGTDDRNLPVAAGLYICRMEAGDFVKTIKLALMR